MPDMTAAGPAAIAAAWLLTYLLHSTLLLGLARLASRRLAARSLKLEETVWRLALAGALATATLQLAAGWQPPTASWTIAGRPAPAAATVAGVAIDDSARLPFSALRLDLSEPLAAPIAVAPAAHPAAAPPEVSWTGLLVVAWAAGVLLLALRLGWSYGRLRRALAGRCDVSGGTAFRLLGAIAAAARLPRPRLTCAPHLPVPVAMGVRRPEVSLPPRALAMLSAAEQETLLAHEVGHLARRDPLWLLLDHAVTALFFLQPLNWVARRRLREISELLADEWSVARTGKPLSLARCLAEVAGWTVGDVTPTAAGVSGMAGRPSQLGSRIRRLLAQDPQNAGAERPVRLRWVVVAASLLLLGVAAVAPGVTATASEGAPVALAPRPPLPPLPALPALPPELPELVELDELGELAELAALDALEEMEWPEPPETPEAPEPPDFDVHLELSEADQARIERLSEEIETIMERELGGLDERLEAAMENGELARLQAEMESLAEQIEASIDEEALERLAAEAEELAERAEQGERGLSEADRRRLEETARRIAEQAKPDPAQLERLRELSERHGRLAREIVESHRPAIEEARKRAEEATRDLRQQLEREMERHREERRRQLDEQRERRQDARLRHEEHRRLAARHRAEALRDRAEHRRTVEREIRRHREEALRDRAEHREMVGREIRRHREEALRHRAEALRHREEHRERLERDHARRHSTEAPKAKPPKAPKPPKLEKPEKPPKVKGAEAPPPPAPAPHAAPAPSAPPAAPAPIPAPAPLAAPRAPAPAASAASALAPPAPAPAAVATPAPAPPPPPR